MPCLKYILPFYSIGVWTVPKETESCISWQTSNSGLYTRIIYCTTSETYDWYIFLKYWL